MDCTQVLESDELNDSLAYKYKVKVAELKVNDNLYPIFSGSNRIGRDPEFCSVVFNNMTLSKEHAVIEVEDRFSHLIYDLGSKNKTRVGKTILKPHIRYQLLDKSQILLGDLSAEYFIIPEEQENKPFAVIQESDDEVIPDTPVQMKSRQSKESSSSREESPTIFEMETQCQLGYIEPSVKTVQDPGVPEGNLAEGSHPGGNENKESSTAGASNTSNAAATGSSDVNICESDDKESTAEVNHSSDGDETDPEDVFFAMTQKRDESLLESSDTERISELKETVENGQPEETGQVVDNSSVVNKITEDSVDNTRQQSTEKVTELPCSSVDIDGEVSRAANQIVVPEEKKIQEEGTENIEEESSLEKEVHPEETHISDSVETSDEGGITSKMAMKELSEENGNEHSFKQPLAVDKGQEKTEKTVQVILPVDEEMPGERIETVNLNVDLGSEDDDSFFNAATQVLQPENQTSEVFKTPLVDTATRQETNLSPERNEPCKVLETNEETRDQECNHESIHEAPVQIIQSEDGENSSGVEPEVKEQVPCVLEGKLNTSEKDDVGDSDSTTDDESSFFNASTQIVHAENEHTDSKSSPGAEPGKPTCSSVSPDMLKMSGKDEQEKEETLKADDKVKEADDFIFTAPTQVLHVKRKESNVSSEKDVEPHAEQNRPTGSSVEEDSENDSIFEAPTQIVINSENLHEGSLKSSGTEKQPEKKEADQKLTAGVPDSETNENDSIYDAETQVFHSGSEVPVTFTTSTPAKKKTVMFVDDCDRHQSIEKKNYTKDHPKQEGTTSKSENEDTFDGATEVVEPGSVESSSSKEPSGEPKSSNDAPAEENEKHMSEHGNNNQEGSSSETKLPNSPQIHPLDDSDDSIFSAPTQIISRPSHMLDETSPRASTSEKFNSSSLGTEVVPEPALQIAKNKEGKKSSEESSCDASRKEDEDTLNDSFFEAATQLYTSTALADVEDSDVADDKANKSLSRSSSYSSIHEAPTQCMDDLVAALNTENAKESAEKNGKTEEIEEKKREVVEGATAEEPLQVHGAATAGAVASLTSENLDLILPSSQELREVGQEFYGYASDDEKPSTSKDVSSPVIQKRTRSIPVKKGILLAKGLESIKLAVASGSGETSSDGKGQPDIESTKRDKLPKDKNGLKKTAGKKKTTAAKGSDKCKKITEYLESNNSRDKSAEKEDKNEENKASDENETGRPSRQRKPTWKARESSQDGLLAPIQKGKKGDIKEQSKVSPGSSKQTKKHVSSPPKEESIAKEDQNRKENSKLPTKMNTETGVNSESKLENNVKQKKSENLGISLGRQSNIHVHSLSSPQSEDEKTAMKKGVKSKRFIEVNKSKTIGLNTSSSPESCSSERKGETPVGPSSSKRRRTVMPLSDSDREVKNSSDESRKGTNEPSLNVEPKPEKGTTRSRRKPSNVPDKSNDVKEGVSPLHGCLQNEEVSQNKRGRPKRTTAIDMIASGARPLSKAALGKIHHESNANVDRQENKDVSSSSIEDKSVNVGKRGRPRRATTSNSASSSDAEVKPGKRELSSGDKQNESRIQCKDDKNRTIPFNRSNRSATNSTSSSEVEIISAKTKEYSVEQQKENSASPCDKLDIRKRGRPKRSVASRASSVEIELKPVVHNKRTQDADICDTPTKERKISVRVSSSEQDENVDTGKKGRAKRSAKKAFGIEKELNAAVDTAQAQRLQGSDICDTPRKQRRNHVPSSESGNVEIVETNRRGRSKRSATPSVSSERETRASSLESSEVEIVEVDKRGRLKRIVKKGVPLEKETGASSLQSDTVEILETNKRSQSKKSVSPRVPLKRKSDASLESGEVEIIGTNERSRSKKSVVPNVPLVSKEELTPTTKVKSGKNTNTTPTTPHLARQRRTILQSGNRTPNKASDGSEQKQSRSRKKGVNVVASDEDQSACGSPSYGSAGRRRKVLSQTSSTESDGHSSQSEGTPKRSSRIKHLAEYHVMFTGVGCSGADEAAIKKLGGKVVQEPEDCTILITDKIRRTFKFLCIMGHGKPIVTPDWIKQSHLSGSFLDPWNFIVKDKEAEKKFKFQLQKSLKDASVKKLLDGYSVFATPSVKPPPTEMKGIVENCGGQFLTKDPSPGKWPEKSFIISALDDKKLCSKFKKSSVPIVSVEILLTGILQQKLNISDYILKL